MKKEFIYILILASIVMVLIFFRKPIKQKVEEKLTRGYRNNNPGNIIKTKTPWKGEVEGKDKRFKTFINMEHGYRAIFVLLRGYIDKGFDTIEKIITRYAPPSENATSSYIKHVSERTGIPKDKKLSFADSEAMKKIVAAISFSENGIKPDEQQIEGGYKLING